MFNSVNWKHNEKTISRLVHCRTFLASLIYFDFTSASLFFSFFSMNAVGEAYRKTTKQLDLEKRRNKLAELLSKETDALQVLNYRLRLSSILHYSNCSLLERVNC